MYNVPDRFKLNREHKYFATTFETNLHHFVIYRELSSLPIKLYTVSLTFRPFRRDVYIIREESQQKE